jgi:ketosteroid isomerase-like protein
MMIIETSWKSLMKQSLAMLVHAPLLLVGVACANDSLLTRTPTQVVEHHIAAMRSHDTDALVADYAADAVIVLSAKPLIGKQQVQEFFQSAAKRRQSGDDNAKFKVARVDGEVVIEEWSHKVADGGTVSGADVFVVRKGKIAFHTTLPAAASAK